jgi:hypothetical protein
LNSEVINKEQFSVLLPCEPENFGSFIGSLLGKPQTISKAYSGSFEITHQDIESVFHLVGQRVKQQNQAILIQFTISLTFDDDSTVLLNSLEDFKGYAEVRPLTVDQVHLSWSYLVQFQDRDHPEKQVIEMSFVSKESRNMILLNSDDSPFVNYSRFSNSGYISFRIEHTARTWGADLESLLCGHIKHILLPESKKRVFVRKHSGFIAFFLATMFFVSSIFACFYSAGQISEEQLSILAPILVDSVNINLKLNSLINFTASGFWGKFFFSVFVFIIVSLITAIFLGSWASSSGDTRKPSYILLTKKSEQYKVLAEARYNRQWKSFIASILVSITTGVIANVIFTSYWSITP